MIRPRSPTSLSNRYPTQHRDSKRLAKADLAGGKDISNDTDHSQPTPDGLEDAEGQDDRGDDGGFDDDFDAFAEGEDGVDDDFGAFDEGEERENIAQAEQPPYPPSAALVQPSLVSTSTCCLSSDHRVANFLTSCSPFLTLNP